VDVIGGQWEHLVSMLQRRYGLTRELAEDAVRDFCDTHRTPEQE
jgi:hypothetical protein